MELYCITCTIFGAVLPTEVYLVTCIRVLFMKAYCFTCAKVGTVFAIEVYMFTCLYIYGGVLLYMYKIRRGAFDRYVLGYL